MKKLFIYLSFAILIINSHELYGQSFTVSVESTKNYEHHITPIKPNGSHELLVTVKNNSATRTVSIDKSLMGVLESWISIENNSQVILPGVTKTFKLTINVPSESFVCECLYYLELNFVAVDDDNETFTFSHYAQIIIIDNSSPISPTFSVSQTSTTIYVSEISSFDERSDIYTALSYDLGFRGIKEFIIKIKDPDGTNADSKTLQYNEDGHYTFTQLDPNKDYKAVVTAVDLVDLTKSTEKSSKTAPAKPTNLNFTNITYIDAILNWSPSAGATGYNVYSPDNVNTPLNSSPIAGTSFLVDGLDTETSYEYYVKAINSGGQSDKSDNEEVTTLALPLIVGDPSICSGTNTYTVQNLVSGYTVSWVYNDSRLNLVSASGSSANFSKIVAGATTIDARITSPNGPVLALEEIDVWVGAPFIQASSLRFTNDHNDGGYFCTNVIGNDVSWTYNYDYLYFDVKVTNFSGTITYHTQRVLNYTSAYLGHVNLMAGTYMVGVQGTNSCGAGNWALKVVEWKSCSSGSGGLGLFSIEVSPNPITTESELELVRNDGEALDSDLKWYFEVYDLNMNKRYNSNNIRGNKHKLKVHNWKKGIYVIRAIVDEEVVTKRFIKK